MLMTMRAQIEAQRTLAYYTATALNIAVDQASNCVDFVLAHFASNPRLPGPSSS